MKLSWNIRFVQKIVSNPQKFRILLIWTAVANKFNSKFALVGSSSIFSSQNEFLNKSQKKWKFSTKNSNSIRKNMNCNLFSVLCVVLTTGRTDVSYCDPNICPPGLSHVACGQDIVCVEVMMHKFYLALKNQNKFK